MTDLLTALDSKASVIGRVCLVAALGVATVLLLVGGLVLVERVGVPVVPLQCAIWGFWLAWLGIVFPRNRRRDEAAPCPFPYRRAFVREILAGVAVAFSQLLRPALSGVLADGPDFPLVPYAAIGVMLVVAGAAIVYLGVAALGVARTLFVYEYVPNDKAVTTDGVFRFLRHPLFLGGSMASLGLALCTGSQAALELGLLNMCVIPIYVQLEDRRCCAALGKQYVDYRATVGGVIPRRRSAINLSALEHQGSGSIRPATPRDLVSTR